MARTAYTSANGHDIDDLEVELISSPSFSPSIASNTTIQPQEPSHISFRTLLQNILLAGSGEIVAKRTLINVTSAATSLRSTTSRSEANLGRHRPRRRLYCLWLTHVSEEETSLFSFRDAVERCVGFLKPNGNADKNKSPSSHAFVILVKVDRALHRETKAGADNLLEEEEKRTDLSQGLGKEGRTYLLTLARWESEVEDSMVLSSEEKEKLRERSTQELDEESETSEEFDADGDADIHAELDADAQKPRRRPYTNPIPLLSELIFRIPSWTRRTPLSRRQSPHHGIYIPLPISTRTAHSHTSSKQQPASLFQRHRLAIFTTAFIASLTLLGLLIFFPFHPTSPPSSSYWTPDTNTTQAWSYHRYDTGTSIGPQHYLRIYWYNATAWSTAYPPDPTQWRVRLDDQAIIPASLYDEDEDRFQKWYRHRYPEAAAVIDNYDYVRPAWMGSYDMQVPWDEQFHYAHCVLALRRYWKAKESGRHVCGRDVDSMHIEHCLGALEEKAFWSVADETRRPWKEGEQETVLWWQTKVCF